jgi:hypothetical protein
MQDFEYDPAVFSAECLRRMPQALRPRAEALVFWRAALVRRLTAREIAAPEPACTE